MNQILSLTKRLSHRVMTQPNKIEILDQATKDVGCLKLMTLMKDLKLTQMGIDDHSSHYHFNEGKVCRVIVDQSPDYKVNFFCLKKGQ
jgi:hypothetical protein